MRSAHRTVRLGPAPPSTDGRGDRVVVVGHDPLLRDSVFAAAAALQFEPLGVEPASLPGCWRQARAVFVGADQAAAVVALGLPRRAGVYLAGANLDELSRWSMPLGAEVIALPEGRAWLSSVLARGSGNAAQVVTVVGGSGGVGASTLAAALAWRAARAGRSTALVDLDALGGGIDLVLGAEAVPGWRWPRLSGAEGHLGDLRPHLPQIDNVSVLSMARGSPLDVSSEPLAAVLGSLQRSFELVVIDPGRIIGPTLRDSLRLASRSLLVVGTSLRSVAAARQFCERVDLGAVGLVVRSQPGGSVPAGAVEDTLGLPLLARVADEPGVRAAAETGDPPGLHRSPFTRAVDRLLAELRPAQEAA